MCVLTNSQTQVGDPMEVGALQWLRWRTSCIAAAQLAQASAPRLGPQAYSHLWQFNCGIRLQKCNYLFTTFLIDQLIIPVADRFRIGFIFLRFHQIRFRFEFVVLSIGYSQSILPWFPVAMIVSWLSSDQIKRTRVFRLPFFIWSRFKSNVNFLFVSLKPIT